MKQYSLKHGDIIKFGRYYQADDSSKEDIEWRVLAVENDKALLLSEKILDCKPYHNEEGKDVTWEICTLRKWLNSDFFNAAFTSDEQEQIALTKVINEDNPWFGTLGGNDTKDKLFLLSLSELINTAYGFNSDLYAKDEARQAQGSDFSKSEGLYVSMDSSYSGNSNWWLRTPGYNSYDACYVSDDGNVYYDYFSYYVGIAYIGVRPALWLNL